MKDKVCFTACVLMFWFANAWSQSSGDQPVPKLDTTASNQVLLKQLFDSVFELIHTPASTSAIAYERAKTLESYIYLRSALDTSYFDLKALSFNTADSGVMTYFEGFLINPNSQTTYTDSLKKRHFCIVQFDPPLATVDVERFISTESNVPSPELTSFQREKLTQKADSIILSYLKYKYKAYKREFTHIGNKYFLKRVRGEVTKDKNNWEYIEMKITYVPTSRSAGYMQITMEGKYYHCGPVGSGPSTEVILSDGKRFDERYGSEATTYSNDLINELKNIINN